MVSFVCIERKTFKQRATKSLRFGFLHCYILIMLIDEGAINSSIHLDGADLDEGAVNISIHLDGADIQVFFIRNWFIRN